MNRAAHLGIAIVTTAFCVLWSVIGLEWFLGLAIRLDDVPGASIFDSSFITFCIGWGGLFVGGLWFAFRNFRRALRFPGKARQTVTPVVSQRYKGQYEPSTRSNRTRGEVTGGGAGVR